LTALYTVQHRLSRDAKFAHRIDDWYEALRFFRYEPCAQFIGDSNTPRCTRRQLLADDDVEPTGSAAQ